MSREARRELRGKVFRLADLVSYQPGTVASRMVLSSRAGNITVFSFDRDEGLSEHTAPYDAVLTVLEGEARIRVAGEDHDVGAGETIILPAHVPHAVYAKTPFKMVLTMILGSEED